MRIPSQVRRIRMENMANGVVDEPLPVTKSKVRKMFYHDFLTEIEETNQSRIQTATDAYNLLWAAWDERRRTAVDIARAEYETLVAEITAKREARQSEAVERWEAAKLQVRMKNEEIDREIRWD